MKPMQPMAPMKPMAPMPEPEAWWPEDLGRPSTTGAQGGMRYAVFPEAKRLLVERDGSVTAYATGDHRIGGASQQSGSALPAFTSQHGAVRLDELERVP